MASADAAISTVEQGTGRIDFATSPEQYRHWGLEVDGAVARLTLHVQENAGLHPGYE